MEQNQYTAQLSRDALERILDYIKASQVIGVCVTGGDALLNPHFWYVAERLSRIPHLRASTITSGWLVTDDIAARLAQYFTAVQVSVDGATATVHDGIRGRKHAFDRAIHTLELLSHYDVQRLVGFTLMRRNQHQLADMVELGKQLGVDLLVIMPLMLIGRAYLHKGEQLNLSPEEEARLEKQVLHLKSQNADELFIDYANTFPRFIEYIQDGLPGVFMHVCADGSTKMLPQFSVSFGNVGQESLDNIWQNRMSQAWTSQVFRDYVSTMSHIGHLQKQERVPYVDENIHFDDLIQAQPQLSHP
jgi:MoaA/NifB/PqqE/SkfB family radical SAM enzyme